MIIFKRVAKTQICITPKPFRGRSIATNTQQLNAHKTTFFWIGEIRQIRYADNIPANILIKLSSKLIANAPSSSDIEI